MSTNNFTFKIRTQFSFIVDDRTLSCILNGLAKQKINITGYFQTKLFEPKNTCHTKLTSNIVRLVVGSTDAENSRDLLGIKDLLCYLNVHFQEKSVIQVVNITPGTTGLFNTIFGSLWCRVTVNALYIGEESIFTDVSDLCCALKILSETTIENCPKQCSTCCSDDYKQY